jgi:hypothetical protein
VKQEGEWATTALADAEIGGTPEKLEANAQLAVTALKKFGADSLNEFLHTTGFGSHPEVIRVFSRIGKAMSEGNVPAPKGGVGGELSREDVLRLRYPSMYSDT